MTLARHDDAARAIRRDPEFGRLRRESAIELSGGSRRGATRRYAQNAASHPAICRIWPWAVWAKVIWQAVLRTAVGGLC